MNAANDGNSSVDRMKQQDQPVFPCISFETDDEKNQETNLDSDTNLHGEMEQIPVPSLGFEKQFALNSSTTDKRNRIEINQTKSRNAIPHVQTNDKDAHQSFEISRWDNTPPVAKRSTTTNINNNKYEIMEIRRSHNADRPRKV